MKRILYGNTSVNFSAIKCRTALFCDKSYWKIAFTETVWVGGWMGVCVCGKYSFSLFYNMKIFDEVVEL